MVNANILPVFFYETDPSNLPDPKAATAGKDSVKQDVSTQPDEVHNDMYGEGVVVKKQFDGSIGYFTIEYVYQTPTYFRVGQDRYRAVYQLLPLWETSSKYNVGSVVGFNPEQGKGLLRRHLLSNAHFEHPTKQLPDSVPVGTILPFSGDLASLDKSKWVECTAEEHKKDSNVPNLEGRFLRGAKEAGERKGSDTVTVSRGGHLTTPGGTGGSPGFHWLESHQSLHIPKVAEHTHSGTSIPKYHAVVYIMRIG